MSQQPTVAVLRRPAATVFGLLGLLAAAGTLLLFVGPSTETDQSTSFGDAAFTAFSAVTSTGLTVVSTADHWTLFGKLVIAALFTLGSLAMMTIATAIVLALLPHLGLRRRITTVDDSGNLVALHVGRLVGTVVAIAGAIQLLAAFALTIRFWMVGEFGFGWALRHGVYTAMSAFANAGFTLNHNSLMQYATDWWVSVVLMGAGILGAVGIPAVLDALDQRGKVARWSPLTKMTVGAHAAFIAGGAALFLAFEASNRDTLGPFGAADKTLVALFQSTAASSSGFFSIDLRAIEQPTSLVADVLMSIGGGPGSSAGGITVTALAVLAVLATRQLRGNRRGDGSWTVPPAVNRAAGTLVILAMVVVMLAAIALTAASSDTTAQEALFEASSAFGNAGWSQGVTPTLGGSGQVIVIVTMVLGRVLPILIAATLLRSDPRSSSKI